MKSLTFTFLLLAATAFAAGSGTSIYRGEIFDTQCAMKRTLAQPVA
jgi:hypothetical protein